MSDGDLDGPVPSWWPYATELPYWHVWRGVSGLLYARRLNSSPPVVVRGEDAVDLRDQIRREQFLRWGEEELHNPGDSLRRSRGGPARPGEQGRLGGGGCERT